MRLSFCLIAIVLFSCGHHTGDKEKTVEDTAVIKTDTTQVVTKPPTDAPQQPTDVEIEVNRLLQEQFPNQWQVVNDSIAKWPKDMFDYFIAGKRKTNPDYPYIAQGDYNVDGAGDWAALVVNTKRDKYRIAIILKSKTIIWNDDVQGAAISTNPKEDIGSIDGKTAKLKGEAINVEFYEKSSWVLYWDGKAFKKIWTGD